MSWETERERTRGCLSVSLLSYLWGWFTLPKFLTISLSDQQLYLVFLTHQLLEASLAEFRLTKMWALGLILHEVVLQRVRGKPSRRCSEEEAKIRKQEVKPQKGTLDVDFEQWRKKNHQFWGQTNEQNYEGCKTQSCGWFPIVAVILVIKSIPILAGPNNYTDQIGLGGYYFSW